MVIRLAEASYKCTEAKQALANAKQEYNDLQALLKTMPVDRRAKARAVQKAYKARARKRDVGSL